MNWLLMAAGCIFLFCMFTGYRKGGARTTLSFVVMATAFVLVLFLLPYIDAVVTGITPVNEIMKEKYIIQPSSEGMDLENSRLDQIRSMERADMPDIYKEAMITNNNYEVYQKLEVENFMEYTGKFQTYMSIRFILFLIFCVVIWLVLNMVIYSSGIYDRLKSDASLNRIMGIMIGAGIGMALVWISFCVIIVLYYSDAGRYCYACIHSSRILELLYDKNVFLEYIIRL